MTSLGQQVLCGVCGAGASGKYFGAFVCLPCKTFFIRCTGDDVDPSIMRCRDNYMCDVSATNRATCKCCRYRKCLSIGMVRKERPECIRAAAGQQLCAVCGDIANGIHFGAVTCEGCKKFFRRGQKEFPIYSCKVTGNCVINPRTRNACRYCRYRKCLSVGMSRQGIRMGRPSKSQRHFIYCKNHKMFCNSDSRLTQEHRNRTYSIVSTSSSSNSDDNSDDITMTTESNSCPDFLHSIVNDKTSFVQADDNECQFLARQYSTPSQISDEKKDIEEIVQLLKTIRLDYLEEFDVINKYLETKYNFCRDSMEASLLPPDDLQAVVMAFVEDIIQFNTKLEVSIIKLLVDCDSLSKEDKYSVIKYGGPLLRFLALCMECWVPQSQTFRHSDFWISCLAHQDPAWKKDMLNMSWNLYALQLSQAERAILLATTLLAVDAFMECPSLVQSAKDKVAHCWTMPWMSFERQDQLLAVIPQIIGLVNRYYHQAETFLLQPSVFQRNSQEPAEFANVPVPQLIKTYSC